MMVIAMVQLFRKILIVMVFRLYFVQFTIVTRKQTTQSYVQNNHKNCRRAQVCVCVYAIAFIIYTDNNKMNK